jgi:hypothetical protein
VPAEDGTAQRRLLYLITDSQFNGYFGDCFFQKDIGD